MWLQKSLRWRDLSRQHVPRSLLRRNSVNFTSGVRRDKPHRKINIKDSHVSCEYRSRHNMMDWRRSRSKVTLTHQFRNHLVFLEGLIHSSDMSNETLAADGQSLREAIHISLFTRTLFWWRWRESQIHLASDRSDLTSQTQNHAVVRLVLWDKHVQMKICYMCNNSVFSSVKA